MKLQYKIKHYALKNGIPTYKREEIIDSENLLEVDSWVKDLNQNFKRNIGVSSQFRYVSNDAALEVEQHFTQGYNTSKKVRVYHTSKFGGYNTTAHVKAVTYSKRIKANKAARKQRKVNNSK